MQTATDLVKKFGDVIDGKDRSNGDNSARVANMMRELYPDGIQPDQYDEVLGMARILDKLSSVTSQEGAVKPRKSKGAAKENATDTGRASAEGAEPQ